MKECNFEVGDTVERVRGCWGYMEAGYQDTVIGVLVDVVNENEDYTLVLEEYGADHRASNFRLIYSGVELVQKSAGVFVSLAEYAPPRLHAPEIHEWADGAPIQYMSESEDWVDIDKPSWSAHTKYRVKPATVGLKNLEKQHDHTS